MLRIIGVIVFGDVIMSLPSNSTLMEVDRSTARDMASSGYQ